jgi:hypothetical protein
MSIFINFETSVVVFRTWHCYSVATILQAFWADLKMVVHIDVAVGIAPEEANDLINLMIKK